MYEQERKPERKVDLKPWRRQHLKLGLLPIWKAVSVKNITEYTCDVTGTSETSKEETGTSETSKEETGTSVTPEKTPLTKT